MDLYGFILFYMDIYVFILYNIYIYIYLVIIFLGVCVCLMYENIS